MSKVREAPALAPAARKPNLRDHALAELRKALMNGELQASELYSAVALAEKLQISTTPVREALLDLSREGLVVAEKNRGFRVAEIVEADLELLARARVLLEVPLLQDVYERTNASGYEDLRNLAEDILRLTDEDDRYEFVRLDRDFHLALVARAGNPFVTDVVADFRNRSRLAFLRSPHDQQEVEESAREHLALLDHLGRGELSRAQDLLTKHILG
ncbi:GntR family transcriptional regulator (plasmid) [Arthrobacter sp. KN11-1C]|uniref:GntR family transcriptional regulator n=1 Tax=Arthrobacter sp. KN11-1C TaxID=3445774 RepID=UPI003FA178F0